MKSMNSEVTKIAPPSASSCLGHLFLEDTPTKDQEWPLLPHKHSRSLRVSLWGLVAANDGPKGL